MTPQPPITEPVTVCSEDLTESAVTATHTTSLDQCPPGLVHVAAHGEIPGGLAWKHESGAVYDVADDVHWLIPATSTPSFEGVPMTPIPTETAAASTDPRVRAYVKETR